MKKEFKFDAIGRDPYPEDIKDAAAFNEKYKSALSIIKESLPAEDAEKFHSHSREPFDYEQPVLDVARDAIARREFKQPIKTPARLSVPSWLYEGAADIVKRVRDVEVLFEQLRFVKQPLRVSVPEEMFDIIVGNEYVKQAYTFYTTNPAGVHFQDREECLEGKRWISLCNTLFVEE